MISTSQVGRTPGALIMDMFTPQCSSNEASKKAATRLYDRNKVKSVEKVLQKCRTVYQPIEALGRARNTCQRIDSKERLIGAVLDGNMAMTMIQCVRRTRMDQARMDEERLL